MIEGGDLGKISIIWIITSPTHAVFRVAITKRITQELIQDFLQLYVFRELFLIIGLGYSKFLKKNHWSVTLIKQILWVTDVVQYVAIIT